MENPAFAGVFERAATAVGASILAAKLALEGGIVYHPAGGMHDARREEIMSARVYLTIAAVVAILYALAFLLIPVQTSLFFSGFAEARAVLYLRFCGAAVLAWGLIVWFARDFRDWDAVRGVLIGSVVGLAINIIINVVATIQGWLTANAWGSTVVLVLLLLGGIYQLMVHGLGARTLR